MVDFSGIQTLIVRIVGEHTDHLTITTVHEPDLADGYQAEVAWSYDLFIKRH